MSVDFYLQSPLANAPDVARYIFSEKEWSSLLDKWRDKMVAIYGITTPLFQGFPEPVRSQGKWPPPFVVHPGIIFHIREEEEARQKGLAIHPSSTSYLYDWLADWWYIPLAKFVDAVVQGRVPPEKAYAVLKALPSDLTMFVPIESAWEHVKKQLIIRHLLGAGVALGCVLVFAFWRRAK